jgi:saccharopine dehydrogenase-like NADP-dependent oxidoreductase
MFDTTPVHINGVQLSPLEFISQLLINEWRLGPEEEDFTVMQVIVKGKKEGKEKKIEYNLLDHYDPKTKTSSMARTTGYTCTAVVNLIAKKLFNQKGVFPPELIGNNKECFDFVMNYLAERGVIWKKTEQ